MVRTLATTLLIFLLLFAAAGVYAQGVLVREHFNIASIDTSITLSHEFIVPGTLMLTLDSAGILQPSLFDLDPRYGTILFGPELRSRLADSTKLYRFEASYSYRPLLLPREIYRRKLVTLVDSTGRKRQVVQPEGDLTDLTIFGRNFQRSGVVSRGFTVGSNRDLTLQSALRLQFSGMITDDVEVLGALTDEQTPIQPSGNTQTLQEIDNIFIEIRSPNYGGTFGKFVATSPIGGYTAYSRKLQGGKGMARYSRWGRLDLVAAISPGKFRSQQMQGRERDQGPYRLVGTNNEREIVVVAGTERVYVDGIAMVRGENNDYVIDYSTAEIFFQTRRPITGISRITVDFEYTDRKYSRSFIAASNSNDLFDSALTVTASYVREADNPDAPVDSLTPGDQSLLRNAGSDRMKAARSGVYFLGRSDTLTGTYTRIDTTIGGRADSIFRYDPSDPNANYGVTFSVAPDGAGDYRKIGFGEYEFVGKGLGEYLPVVYLPLPELRQVASIAFRTNALRGIDLAGEAAFSNVSLNRFASDPASQLNGTAFTLQLLGIRDSLTVAGADIGALRFSGRAQYLGAGFQTVERLGEVEFGNRWNVRSRPGESGISTFIAEDTLSYLPWRRLAIAASNGYLRLGGDFSSFRQEYSARLFGDSVLPSADYTFELISTDTLQGSRRGEWYKQRGGIGYTIGSITPELRAEYEHREDRTRSAFTDTLYPGSFRFLEVGPDLRADLPFMTTTASFRYRLEDSVRYDSAATENRFLRDGTSRTFRLQGALRGVRDLSSTIDLTYRLKTYDSIPNLDPLSRLEKGTILARSQTRWSGFNRGLDLDALYDVQTEQAARLQRLFVRVPFGQGEYVWVDLDSNGRQSSEEFRPAQTGEGEYVRYDVPTEQLFPVINLTTSARIRLQPAQFITDGWLGALLKPVTSETYLRLEEKSQSERESDIYLLRLGRFQNDSTTILGDATIQQDLNFFDGNPEYSFRLSYLGIHGLTRLLTAIERNESSERLLHLRWHPTDDIGLKVEFGGKSEALRSTDTSSKRTFDLSGLTGSNDFSYRPEQSLELGWLLKLVSSRDVLPATPRTTMLNTNEIRAVYSIETKGQIRLSIERTNVSGANLGGDALAIPYQLTNGYAIGTSWIGRAAVEYRFGGNIQASLSYTGRAQPPTMRVLHIGQAEVRAFF